MKSMLQRSLDCMGLNSPFRIWQQRRANVDNRSGLVAMAGSGKPSRKQRTTLTDFIGNLKPFHDRTPTIGLYTFPWACCAGSKT